MIFFKKYTLVILAVGLLMVGCDMTSNADEEVNPIPENATFSQSDQVGRPTINTVFVSSGNKDAFNTTIPSKMEMQYQKAFKNKLLALNPNYTENALGQDSTQFSTLLANDVLNVAMSGKTTFFDGTNVLTGRMLGDDVIDTELLLIFGGPDGSDNPGLTSDNVDSNDKEFSNTFPYLAAGHQ